MYANLWRCLHCNDETTEPVIIRARVGGWIVKTKCQNCSAMNLHNKRADWIEVAERWQQLGVKRSAIEKGASGSVIVDFRDGELIWIMPVANNDEQANSLSDTVQVLATLDSVIRHAREFHDGHFFIFSFTTHYKGGFGTLDLDTGEGRDEVRNLPAFSSIKDLLDCMLELCCGCIGLQGSNV
jgi:hypothetical protein